MAKKKRKEKHLFLLRHAKSSWDQPELADIDRPLNDRGRRNVPTMGERMAARGLIPDMILASPAERALHTAMMIAPFLNFPSNRVETDEHLYLADTDVLLSVTQMCDDNVNVLMLVGHNPGMTQFANLLSDVVIDNVPTCGLVHTKFDIEHWHELTPGTGDFVLFDYPKKQ